MDSSRRQPFSARRFFSVLTALSCLAIIISGVILFIKPPGRVAHSSDWSLWSLTMHEWAGLHIWFATVFLTGALFHTYLNWRALLSYFKTRGGKAFALRPEWLLALFVCGVVGAGSLTELKPFSSLLAWQSEIKHGWEGAGGGSCASCESEGETGKEGCQESHESDTETAGKGHGGGRGGGGAGKQGGQGGGGGRGFGRMALDEYCAEAGIDMKQAIETLHKAGIEAEAGSTLRDLADSAGVHPREITEMLGGE